ncbi:hypothetical protein CY34DRAFT_801973 [Suillus luteus UH-Slu-Lm8-n1]|uniref:Uncharacterized protein n=1 Tax=Suillus luteus UH-Slu-Lm8-n1 TaxID=930992 RepID=A0A0D0BPQ0_9AGAM|nr:hypothetical protein CY34DRAFT_801973 [Suillus luteus UH-Slu-Lm8-n1]
MCSIKELQGLPRSLELTCLILLAGTDKLPAVRGDSCTTNMPFLISEYLFAAHVAAPGQNRSSTTRKH